MPGRHINDHHIERRPKHIVHHLHQCALHHRPAPHHWRPFIDQKADGHRFDAELLDGLELVIFRLRLLPNAKQTRHRRAIDVGIQKPDLQSLLCEP
ncbi:MAG: hypothetical protein WDM89_10710 [Rhizomicrobium sp.]